VAIGDHVDALHGRDRLDIFQALDRLDRHTNNNVGIGPWRIPGRVTGAIAPVSGVHPLPRDTAIADRRKFRLPRNRPRLLGGFLPRLCRPGLSHPLAQGDLHYPGSARSFHVGAVVVLGDDALIISPKSACPGRCPRARSK
jgi:hypothetical protein